MPTIAYLANQFPSPVEPYVGEEILELRRRGAAVIASSVWRPEDAQFAASFVHPTEDTVNLQPLRWRMLARALWLCALNRGRLRDLLARVVVRGNESPLRRAKALLHTWLGAYYALLLEERGVEHIHVHHGYFSAWIAMVAARLLGISYSMTLHGSDLLLNGAYLDTKLEHCTACFTISEYNRNYIRKHYPGVDERRLILRRLGVEAYQRACTPAQPVKAGACLVLLSVGRLHPVKNHSFLLEACALLKACGANLLCLIAGDGPEKRRLQWQIAALDLKREVKLLGHVPHGQIESLYPLVDLVVLTSKSEGIPLVLMEAMAHGKPVLAPAITGIPELVRDGKTGFLYQPGAVEDFVARVEVIRGSLNALGPLRRAAREHVRVNFNRELNLQDFADVLLERISPQVRACHENPVLQQI